jgi:trimeric autotransporter adhesin
MVCCFNLMAQTWAPVGVGVIGCDTLVSGLYADPVEAFSVYHGKLYIGGKFIYSGDRKMNNLACWNGKKIDTVGKGLDSVVCALYEYDGKLCIGGGFYKKIHGRQTAANLVQWKDTVGTWNEMGDGFSHSYYLGYSPAVFSFCKYKNELYAAGYFWQSGNDRSIKNVAEWDGQKWCKTAPMAEMVFCNWIDALQVYYQKLYMGGDILFHYNPDERNALPIRCWDGKKIEKVESKTDKVNGSDERNISIHNIGINTFAVYNGELYAGGTFDTIDGNHYNNIARWNDTCWSNVGEGIQSSFFTKIGVITAMAVYHNKLYVAGGFDSAGGKPALNVACWDGKQWSAVGNGLQLQGKHDFNGRVRCLAVYNDELYAGGLFNSSGKIQLRNLAVLHNNQSPKSK